MDQPVCTEHKSLATGTCPRCGTFLCPRCTWQTLCELCYRRGIPAEAHAFRIQGIAQASLGAFLVSLAVLAYLALRARPLIVFVPLVWLAGIGAGVTALWLRRGAPAVAGPALSGIALNALSIILFVLLALHYG